MNAETEVMDMIEEGEYLSPEPDFIDWNEEANAPDEFVLDYDFIKKRADQIEEMVISIWRSGSPI